MKVAISAAGETLESAVDPRFGRAAKFILYDLENDTFTAHDNKQNLNAAQGAGIQSAQTVVDLGADWLISGHCGPKAFRVLASAGVKVAVGAEGTVAEAIERFKRGEFQESGGADVEGHWS